MTRNLLAPALLLAASALAAAPARGGAQQSGPPLSEQALRARLYAIADDSMAGRNAGSAGNRKATAYIAAEFQLAGLDWAGERRTYLQEIPLSVPIIDDWVTLSIDGRVLDYDKEYLAINQGTGARSVDGATVVYAGRWDDQVTLLPGDSVSGKVVLIAFDATALGPRVKAAMTSRYSAAAGICIASLDRMSANQRWNAAPLLVRLDTAKAIGPVVPSFFFVGDSLAARLIGGPLADAVPGQGGVVLHGAIRFRKVATPARNVIAVLSGSDPRLSGEYVVIGAHNDHLGVTRYAKDPDSLRAYNVELRRRVIAVNGPLTDSLSEAIAASVHVNMDSVRALHPAPRLDSIFNGADDDGSGTVALLEIARAFAAAPMRPRRSILFVSHTAEEMSSMGSRWFTDRPTVPLDSVVAMINLDMIGRGGVGEEPGGGPNYLALVGTRRLSTELGDLVEKVSVAGKFGWKFDYSYDAPGHPEQVYCRSDHTNYARFGIPVAFMMTGYHADYHELTDEAQYIDYAKLSKVSRFAYQVAAAIANLDHRVVRDKPVPDPKASCVQ